MDKLNLMTSFVAVVEEGSFTAAAKRLGKTTALISTHVTQLEESLGVRLVTRSTRSLKLTSTGQGYYAEAKRLLDDFASLEAKVRQEHDSLIGDLRVSAPTTFGEIVLVPLIAELIANNPNLNVELSLNDRFVDIISEGFDLAVRIGYLEDSSLVARKVGLSKLRLCASPAFIQQHGGLSHPEQLQNLPCVLDTNLRTNNIWLLSDGEQEFKVKPKVMMKVNSAIAAAQIAKRGLAISYSPEFAIKDDLAAGHLIPILDTYCQSAVPISVLYTHRKHLSARVSAFVEMISQHFLTELGNH